MALNLPHAAQQAAGNLAASELQRVIQRVIRAALFPQLLAAADAAAALASNAYASAAAPPPPPPQQQPPLQHQSRYARLQLEAAQPPYLRLHPDSRERRRLVQRCRQLKADLSRFEESFRAASQSGREPRSAAERAPMAEVYDEYRALKQTIRDGAALHIQAAFRGHCARVRLRRGPATAPAAAAAALAAANAAKGTAMRSAAPASSAALSLSSASSIAEAPAARPTISLSSAAAPTSDAMLRLTALRDEKAALKRRLRQFDVNFSAQHGGRNPAKAEKEHLRPQYARYHELKAVIADAEIKAGVGRGGSSGGGGGEGGGESESPPADNAARREAGFGAGLRAAASSASATSSARLSSSAIAAAASQPLSLGVRGRSESAGSVIGLNDDDDDDATASGAAGSSATSGGGAGSGGSGAGSGPLSQESQEKVALLKAEKKKLQAALREYERDFLQRNGRPVKFVKDIHTVMGSYQRYKQLKQQLRELLP